MLAGDSRFDVVFTDERHLQAGRDYDTKWRPSNDRSGAVDGKVISNHMSSWLSKDNFLIKRREHMRNRRLALLLALCLLSAGCVLSIPSEPGAENVTMTHKEADVASCAVLGNVDGLTETNYVRDERREMQNQAVGLGGDTILLTHDRDPPKGTAYRCNPSVTKKSH
jgi:hypothetical protein